MTSKLLTKTAKPRGRKGKNPDELPNALRLIRLHRGFTVPQLEAVSGIHRSSIKRWEYSTKGIRHEKLQILARYLDVPLYLLYMKPHEAKQELPKFSKEETLP